MHSLAPRFALSRWIVALGLVLPALPASAQTLSQNLIYTSLQPCRLADTRSGGGRIQPGAANARTFNAVGVAAPGSLSSQGGNPNGCPVPGFIDLPQVQAVLVNLVAVVPAGAGDLRAWPSDQTTPNAAVINYATGLTIANAVVLPVRQDHPGGDITVQADVSATDLVIDILGYFSAGTPTAAQDNLFLGPESGNAATSGFQNTAVGAFSLQRNTSGLLNVAVGANALTNNANGVSNTAAGAGALQANTSGSHNTAVGNGSLAAGTGGNFNNNTALGFLSLANDSSGSNNTAVGVGALANSLSGSSNVALGFNAGSALAGGESSDLDLANPGVDGESNTIRIGTIGTHTAAFIAGINGNTSSSGTAVFINSQGQLGTTTSSLRFKEDVDNMGSVSDLLLRLRPVTFHYRPEYDDGSHLLQYGLVAEEVAEIAPGLVQYGPDGRPTAVRYHFVNAMLLSEAQQQHRKVAELETRLASQQAEIEALRGELHTLAARAAGAPAVP
ncbi:MAG TPA: tail fiber domain-containing protein [Thermoanaerobaculia bacterium]|nr:tail fiber domain-containing protein [Thermoanaerobaculia bacterium]